MVVFLSDNGLLWGEHRLMEPEDVGVRGVDPRAAHHPLRRRSSTRRETNDRLVANVDLAPTFAALARRQGPGARGPEPAAAPRRRRAATRRRWRTRLHVEHLRGAGGISAEVPTYCAVRSKRYKYVVYSTHEEELYDLVADRHELVNRAVRSHAAPDARSACAPTCRPALRPAPARVRPRLALHARAAPGATSVTGTPAGETICGRKAGELLAGPGRERHACAAGAATTGSSAAPGADQLIGGAGRDVLDGGPGDDIVLARDGEPGQGRLRHGLDLVYADKRDLVARDCERVRRFKHS